jgi:hypothetical protein
MVTQKMGAKKKSLLLVLVLVVGYLGMSAFTTVRVYQQKKELKLVWSETYSSAKNISDITPNFIYIGKHSSIHQNDLLTRLARLRLSLENELKTSKDHWSTTAIDISDKLISEQDNLSLVLQKDAGLLKMKDHLQALQSQWIVRKEVYKKERILFKVALNRYQLLKNSKTGFLSRLLDK